MAAAWQLRPDSLFSRADWRAKAPFESKQWYIDLEKASKYAGKDGARERFLRAQGKVDDKGNLLVGYDVHHAVFPQAQYAKELPDFVKNNLANLRLTISPESDVTDLFLPRHAEVDIYAFVGEKLRYLFHCGLYRGRPDRGLALGIWRSGGGVQLFPVHTRDSDRACVERKRLL